MEGHFCRGIKSSATKYILHYIFVMCTQYINDWFYLLIRIGIVDTKDNRFIVQIMISYTPESEFLYLYYFFNAVVSISLKYKLQKHKMTERRAFQFQKKV